MLYIIRLIAVASVLLSTQSLAAGVFNRGSIGEPDSLDPHMTTSGYAGNVIFDMFLGLTTVDTKVNVIPGAAESWTISPDGKTYTFTMRQGMQWSDGKPVTAQDFEYAFRRTMDPATASRAAPMFYLIANGREVNTGKLPVENLGVRAINARTFEITLLHPAPYFLELIVHRCFPVPRWAVEAHGAAWTRPENIVVNGAFKLAEWVPNGRIRLAKNPKFYDAANVALDEVNYYVTEDQVAGLNRYRAGEIDHIPNVPPGQLDWLRENLPKDLRITQNLGLYYYTFNTRKPPFDDPRVRNALSMVIDRDTIVDKIMRGGELAAYSLIPPGARKGYEPPASPWAGLSMTERVAKAKALMAEAGFGPGKPLKFTFRYNTDDVQRRAALAASQAWKAIGAEVELANSDLNTLNADLRNGDYQAARYQWLAEYADPTSFLFLLESTSTGDNHSKYANPVFDAVMAKVYAEVDIGKRNALMGDAEAIILADSPVTPINFYVSKRLVKPRFVGFDDNVRGINISRYISIAQP